MIKVEGLEKSFDGQRVLNGLDLTVGEGELVAVIGSSGGGKSVLLKHIIGLLRPDRGSILIDGDDITRLRGRELDEVRQRLGVLFQGGALFDSLTVYQNIAFPLREKTELPEDEIRSRVLRALEDVGLTGSGRKYPAELSGGMKKRAALARALITEPTIVLFDEPTTGLDPIILNSIHRLIKETHRRYGYTGLLVSHEIPEIYDIADTIAMIHDGAIVETGTPGEIKGSPNPVVRNFITGGREGEGNGKKV